MQPKERMKTQPSHLSVLVSTLGLGSLCVLLVLALTGCATSTYKQADSAAISLQKAAEEVQVESHELNVSMACLQDLVNKPGPDLKPQFLQFSKAVDRLDTAVARNELAAQKVAEKHNAYFNGWNQQITNMNYEAVRTHSQARETEVATRFENVNRRYAEARTAMRPMLNYLFDIRRALAADLTREGLESVKPVVANGVENAGKVQIALANLKNELSSSGTRMASHTVQPIAPVAQNTPATNLTPTGQTAAPASQEATNR